MKTKFTIKTYLIIALIGGVISTILIGVLSMVSKDISILGLSNFSALFLILNLLAISALIFLITRKAKDPIWTDQLKQKATLLTDTEERKTQFLLVSLGGFLLGFYFIFHTLTTTNPLHQNYFPYFIPWAFWVSAICGQSLIFIFLWDKKSWTIYIKKNGFALLTLIVILGAGFTIHSQLRLQNDLKAYSQDDVIDKEIEEQDIYLVYKEGRNLSQGENPYARAAETEEIRWNSELPTYLPIIYYGSWLTHEMGFTKIFPWLGVWRRVFLFFNLATAYLLFNTSHHRYKATVLGIFAALFWLFNRWTLHVTTIYHFNFIPIFFLVLSLSLLPKRKIVAYLFFGLSLGLKHNAIFLTPIFLIWAWQESKEKPIQSVLIAGLTIASVPLLASLPFIILNPEGFFKSLLISLTRFPETQLGVLSLDAFMGWIGLPAKIPMLVMLFITYWMAWRGKLKPFTAGLLVMLVFVNFHSILFRHYMAWVIPLLPLTVAETLMEHRSQIN